MVWLAVFALGLDDAITEGHQRESLKDWGDRREGKKIHPDIASRECTAVVINPFNPEKLTVSILGGAGAFKPWDNPGNLMDHATMQTTETIVNVALLTVVVVVGVIGNVLNMIVFAKQGLSDRINVCLFSLAVADCGYLLALFVYRFYSHLALFSRTMGNYWKVRSLNTVYGVIWGFSTVSVLLTLLVSVERCLCVVSPLKTKQLLKTKVMVILIVLIYFLILSSSLIFNSKYVVETKEDAETNSTVYVAVLSDFYLNNQLVVNIVFYNILIITIPCCSFIIVVICTTATVIFLKRALSWKRTSANMAAEKVDKRETVLTKMLVLICYAFVFFMTPTVLNAFLVQFFPGWGPLGHLFNTFYVYVAMMHLFSAINSSLNFFIYYFCASKYRSTLRELCCCRGDHSPQSRSPGGARIVPIQCFQGHQIQFSIQEMAFALNARDVNMGDI
ncbi:uncharacterized protein LOC143285252 [Babylonia areolata]|uniref:uncharacterized protein LOC143285252 n=1 Tax=Babylonia areolata TaxID=304850 RepID=UPI003FD65DAF